MRLFWSKWCIFEWYLVAMLKGWPIENLSNVSYFLDHINIKTIHFDTKIMIWSCIIPSTPNYFLAAILKLWPFKKSCNIDLYLIEFLELENVHLDTKIMILSCLVQKLCTIWSNFWQPSLKYAAILKIFQIYLSHWIPWPKKCTFRHQDHDFILNRPRVRYIGPASSPGAIYVICHGTI